MCFKLITGTGRVITQFALCVAIHVGSITLWAEEARRWLPWSSYIIGQCSTVRDCLVGTITRRMRWAFLLQCVAHPPLLRCSVRPVFHCLGRFAITDKWDGNTCMPRPVKTWMATMSTQVVLRWRVQRGNSLHGDNAGHGGDAGRRGAARSSRGLAV